MVLAYSGGLDTTVAVRWFSERGVEVHALTVDVGQGADRAALEERALSAGAASHVWVDARREFVERFAWPAVRANALYEGKYPLSSALSRPLIVEKLVETAREVGADAVAHGCTSKGNDQVRFDLTAAALAPDLAVIAPTRIWSWTREEELRYARERGLEIPKEHRKYSVDQNLWGRSVEGSELEDPWVEPPPEAFEWTVDPSEAPRDPLYVTLGFEGGTPTSLDGEELPPEELVSELNRLAGSRGVGRIDHMESRVVGFKSREVYECPAATVLLEAHLDLEKLVLTKDELRFKSLADREWTRLVYEGLWASPLRERLEDFISALDRPVTGEVRIRLHAGTATVVGRRAESQAYSLEVAGYDEGWYPTDEQARGFIAAWGLPTWVARGARG